MTRRLSADDGIGYTSHTNHVAYIMDTYDISSADDANRYRGSSALHALVGGQVQCVADERLA